MSSVSEAESHLGRLEQTHKSAAAAVDNHILTNGCDIKPSAPSNSTVQQTSYELRLRIGPTP